MYDREHFHAIIIGGGPAGASCALWLKQMNIPALLLEKSTALGGLQRHCPDALSNHYLVTSAGHRSRDIAANIHENITRFGAPFVLQTTIAEIQDDGTWFRVDFTTPNGRYTVYSRYLVIATGVQHKSGGLDASERIYIGGSNKRIRTGNFFAGKRIAILGGGDSAMETYAFLKKQAPAELKVFARTVRANPVLRDTAGEDLEVGEYEVNGEALQVTKAGATSQYDYFMVMYGFEAGAVLPPALEPARNARGFLAADENAVTSNPRILAIGESSQRMHPCVATSVADGVIAAKYLEKNFKGEN